MSKSKKLNELEIFWEDLEAFSWGQTYKNYILSVLTHLEIKEWELSVTFCRDSFIQTLNREYRSKDEPTDILSFVQDGENRPDIQDRSHLLLGDLVISLDTLTVNAAYFHVSEDEELKRITLHGLMHLQGWDHETNEDSEPMLMAQEIILKEFVGVKVLS